MAQSKRPSSKRPARRHNKADSNDACFVIMPFGGYFDDYYELIYRPAIQQSGLQPRRADDLFRPSAIINDIWAWTREARLILAEISGKNPNVFYELGLAHALAKPAVLVTASMDDVPFDLRQLRVIEYDKNQPDWGEVLKEKVAKAISEVLAAPAQAVLPTFVSIVKSPEPVRIDKYEAGIMQLRGEVDSLRREMVARPFPEREEARPFSGPEEASSHLKSLIRRGYPDRLIKSRLVERGAPEEWVENEIRQVRQKRHIGVGGKPTPVKRALQQDSQDQKVVPNSGGGSANNATPSTAT